MLEEIADSMTPGGRVAALVGLVAALFALVLHLREYRRRPPQTGTRDEAPSPVDDAVSVTMAPELPDQNAEDAEAGEPPSVDTQPAPPENMPEASTPNPGAGRPGSLFKPYVPPGK